MGIIATKGSPALADAPPTTVRGADLVVLAAEGNHPALGAFTGRVTLHNDSASFRAALGGGRPKLVALFSPPATNDDIVAVAAARRRQERLRVILVNEPAAVDVRLAALRDGFDDALPDTVDQVELCGRLSLLAASAASGSAAIRATIAPGITLEFEARELRVHGVSVHLRPREFALLHFLALHPGRTYTRDELLSAVGAGSSVRDLRTIDVHIRWLREKLNVDPSQPPRLRTVRGVGYRLERER